MSWLETLARPSIINLRAYKSARSIASDAGVFLDANEAPDSGIAGQELNRYPLPQPAALLQRFAGLYGVDQAQILMGRGSDEAIDVLTRAFCEPGQDSILLTPPTYGMYEVSADIQNAPVVRVSLLKDGAEWKLDVPGMTRAMAERNIKLVYVCSPNNPTGTVFSNDDIRALCRAASRSIVVIDEAYIEFDPSSSCVPLLNEFRHLVILRTLSKAWGLAGLRCGVMLGDPALIALLQKVRAPYPLPRPVVGLALQATSDLTAMQDRVARVTSERRRLENALRELPVVKTIYSSKANFLLIEFQNEAAVMSATNRAGIIVRSRDSEPCLKNCVRITVGGETENDLLLKVLSEVQPV